MISELVQNKVYYTIFDKSNKHGSYIYGKYKTNDPIKISEIDENLNTILSDLNAEKILILNQVHGNKIVDADKITSFKLEPEADGAVTTKKNIVLSVQSADCVPILASSSDGKIIGVAHSGWKSARLGIIEKLVDKMKEKGAKEIIAVIGPSIQQNSYEVDREFYHNFIDFNQSNEIFFITSKNQNHYMFDISGFVEHQLKTFGVNVVHRIMEDTYSNQSKYPSYRRSCHEGKLSKVENILSTVVIK